MCARTNYFRRFKLQNNHKDVFQLNCAVFMKKCRHSGRVSPLGSFSVVPKKSNFLILFGKRVGTVSSVERTSTNLFPISRVSTTRVASYRITIKLYRWMRRKQFSITTKGTGKDQMATFAGFRKFSAKRYYEIISWKLNKLASKMLLLRKSSFISVIIFKQNILK